MRQGDKETLKNSEEHVVGRCYVVAFHEEYCFIAPYAQLEMPKLFKEQCRMLKVPQKLRPYLFQEEKAWQVVEKLLQ